MSVDPVEAVTQQAYVYADDNPINETDPLGTHPTLDKSEYHMAELIFSLALHDGLSCAEARQMVAASYMESTLDPTKVNSRGASGLFQLLSPGYKERAIQLGGLLNPTANTEAIMPSYKTYWKANPDAPPGEAASVVEASGEPASWYAQPLSWLPKTFPPPPRSVTGT
jgi:hypothetical protein